MMNYRGKKDVLLSAGTLFWPLLQFSNELEYVGGSLYLLLFCASHTFPPKGKAPPGTEGPSPRAVHKCTVRGRKVGNTSASGHAGGMDEIDTQVSSPQGNPVLDSGNKPHLSDS